MQGKGGVSVVKPIVEIARVFLNAREGVIAANEAVQLGKRDPLSPVGRDYLTGVMEALAWVLEVDLHQMNAPKVAGQLEPPAEVQMSWIDAYGCYFVEFPPDEMQYQQEYRAEFLSSRQALQLLDELRLHVLNRAHLMPAEYEEVVRRDREERRARKARQAGAPEPVQLSAVRAAQTPSSVDVGDDGELPEGA